MNDDHDTTSDQHAAVEEPAADTAAAVEPGPETETEPETDSDGFADLGLRDELLAALDDLGYEEPTPIQRETIPLLLTGQDLLGQAATGTGKTAAFALPALQMIDASRRVPQVLVLVPTRELAVQVSEAMFKYGSKLGVKVVPVFGGQPIGRQLQALDRGAHVVVATPGRALDHIGRGSLALDAIQTVILDEADEMLDMGFTDDIETILESTPDDRQTVLFSATMPKRIISIAKRYQREPQRITIGRPDAEPGVKALVRQVVYVVQRAHKPSALGRILDIEAPKSALVFCRTRTEVDQLTVTMNGRGYRAEALHGGMDQAQRDRVMSRLRDGTAELLVATDVAARGLDIDTLTHVVNYDVPSAAESYVHRIGRVGRAGREGVAITLAEPRERRGLENIERLTKQKFDIAKVPTVADLPRTPDRDDGRGNPRSADLGRPRRLQHGAACARWRGQRPQHRAGRHQAGARIAWSDHRRTRDPRCVGSAAREVERRRSSTRTRDATPARGTAAARARRVGAPVPASCTSASAARPESVLVTWWVPSPTRPASSDATSARSASPTRTPSSVCPRPPSSTSSTRCSRPRSAASGPGSAASSSDTEDVHLVPGTTRTFVSRSAGLGTGGTCRRRVHRSRSHW